MMPDHMAAVVVKGLTVFSAVLYAGTCYRVESLAQRLLRLHQQVLLFRGRRSCSTASSILCSKKGSLSAFSL